jgi:biopolymer transport protein ExbB
MFGYNPWELFLKGGVIMWPLLACSVAAVALILERTFVLLTAASNYETVLEKLRAAVLARDIPRARQNALALRGPIARVASAYLTHWGHPEAVRDEVVSRTMAEETSHLERRLNWLAVLAQVTPLLGLLGTVIGLMAAFQVMDSKGTQVKSADLATGIWQKLLNTAFGLAIAIPCLMIYFGLEGRLRRIQDTMGWMVSHLQEWHGLAQITPAEKGS